MIDHTTRATAICSSRKENSTNTHPDLLRKYGLVKVRFLGGVEYQVHHLFGGAVVRRCHPEYRTSYRGGVDAGPAELAAALIDAGLAVAA